MFADLLLYLHLSEKCYCITWPNFYNKQNFHITLSFIVNIKNLKVVHILCFSPLGSEVHTFFNLTVYLIKNLNGVHLSQLQKKTTLR